MLKSAGRILFAVLWLGLFAFLTLLVFIPYGTGYLLGLGYEPGPEVTSWLIFFHETQLPAMHLFVPIWVFFVGACMASFLNVVAWRIPRGQSIIGPSRCPECGIELKFPKSNFPILGWMSNGGACAHCSKPIPVRYLIAEIVLAAAFLSLFRLQTCSGGATIPFRDFFEPEDYERSFFWIRSSLPIILVYHWILLSLIFTVAIAATENFAAPRSVVLFGVLGLLAFQFFAAEPGILDFRFGNAKAESVPNPFLGPLTNPRAFLLAAANGGVAAAFCFLLIRFATNQTLHGCLASLLLVGISLGWQSVFSVAALSCAIALMTKIRFASSTFLATLVHLLTWRLQTDCQWWPGPASGPLQLFCGCLYVALLAFVFRFTKSAIESSSSTEPEQIDLPLTGTDLE